MEGLYSWWWQPWNIQLLTPIDTCSSIAELTRARAAILEAWLLAESRLLVEIAHAVCHGWQRRLPMSKLSCIRNILGPDQYIGNSMVAADRIASSVWRK